MLPAPRHGQGGTEEALYAIWLVTAKARDEQADRAEMITARAVGLAAFPGDVVMDALRAYRGVHFPTLEELRRLCETDPRYRRRRRMILAIEQFLAGAPGAAERMDAERRRVTPEEAAAIRARHRRPLDPDSAPGKM